MRALLLALIMFIFCQPAAASAPVNGHDVLFTPQTAWLNTRPPADGRGREGAAGAARFLDLWLHQLHAYRAGSQKARGRNSATSCSSSACIQPSFRVRRAMHAFFLRRNVLASPTLSSTIQVSNVWDQFHVNAWPTLILLDGEGRDQPLRRRRTLRNIKSEVSKGTRLGIRSSAVERRADDGGEERRALFPRPSRLCERNAVGRTPVRGGWRQQPVARHDGGRKSKNRDRLGQAGRE